MESIGNTINKLLKFLYNMPGGDRVQDKHLTVPFVLVMDSINIFVTQYDLSLYEVITIKIINEISISYRRHMNHTNKHELNKMYFPMKISASQKGGTL